MWQRNLKKPCLNRLPVCPFFRWRCKWRPSVVLYGNLKLAHDGFSTGLWSWKVGSSDFCWDARDYNIEGYKSIQVLQVILNLLAHSWLQHKLDRNQTKHVVALYRSANVYSNKTLRKFSMNLLRTNVILYPSRLQRKIQDNEWEWTPVSKQVYHAVQSTLPGIGVV